MNQVDPLPATRVLDLTRTISGAYAARILAGAGADVVMVEPPEGSPLRRWGRFMGEGVRGTSVLHQLLSAQKRSLCLRNGVTDRVLERLVAQASVVLVDHGAADDPIARGRDASPELIVGRLTGGDEDLLTQARSGWLHQCGEPGGVPQRAFGRLGGACVPGVLLALGVLASLRSAASARDVSVEAREAQLAANRYYETTYSYRGESRPRMGHRLGPTYHYTRAADGWVALCATTDQQWQMLAALLGRADWLDDPELATAAGRIAHADRIEPAIDAWLASQTRADGFHTAQAARVPFGIVSTVSEVLRHAQLEERGFWSETPGHRDAVCLPGSPFGPSLPWRGSSPPARGEHTVAVLEDWLGMSRDAIVRLRRAGVA